MTTKVKKLTHGDFERVPVIGREVMEKLRRLAIPIVRLIALQGLFNSEIRINSHGVYVFSPDAGSLFTPEEEAEIFQEETDHE